MQIEQKLTSSERRALGFQRVLCRSIAAPILWPGIIAWLGGVRGYRFHDIQTARDDARRLIREANGPVMICANHLTWIDSLLIQWMLASPLEIARGRFLTWNVPEHNNFARVWWLRFTCYVGRCVSIKRGGPREEQAKAVRKLAAVLRDRDLVVIFPEGGRGRSGKVDEEQITYGVGRIADAVSDCVILCLYLRGDAQTIPTVLPDKNERFSVKLSLLKPSTPLRGLRRQREIARQIGAELIRLEEQHFADRQRHRRSRRLRDFSRESSPAVCEPRACA